MSNTAELRSPHDSPKTNIICQWCRKYKVESCILTHVDFEYTAMWSYLLIITPPQWCNQGSYLNILLAGKNLKSDSKNCFSDIALYASGSWLLRTMPKQIEMERNAAWVDWQRVTDFLTVTDGLITSLWWCHHIAKDIKHIITWLEW